MKITVRHYVDLTVDDFHDLIALRIAVFVVEQNCPYLELDGKDKKAYHLIVRNESAKITGTLRIFAPGSIYNEACIGRVASHPEHRNEKLGHRMMEAAMEFIEKQFGHCPVRISAQSHLCNFYAKYGFATTGHEYLEDGIPHSEMLYIPQK